MGYDVDLGRMILALEKDGTRFYMGVIQYADSNLIDYDGNFKKGLSVAPPMDETGLKAWLYGLVDSYRSGMLHYGGGHKWGDNFGSSYNRTVPLFNKRDKLPVLDLTGIDSPQKMTRVLLEYMRHPKVRGRIRAETVRKCHFHSGVEFAVNRIFFESDKTVEAWIKDRATPYHMARAALWDHYVACGKTIRDEALIRYADEYEKSGRINTAFISVMRAAKEGGLDEQARRQALEGAWLHDNYRPSAFGLALDMWLEGIEDLEAFQNALEAALRFREGFVESDFPQMLVPDVPGDWEVSSRFSNNPLKLSEFLLSDWMKSVMEVSAEMISKVEDEKQRERLALLHRANMARISVLSRYLDGEVGFERMLYGDDEAMEVLPDADKYYWMNFATALEKALNPEDSEAA